MATHPAQNGCTCDWSGDDHYPEFVKWNPHCPMHVENPRKRRLEPASECLHRDLYNWQRYWNYSQESIRGQCFKCGTWKFYALTPIEEAK